MSKRVKVLASLFFACVMLFAGTMSAFAAADGGDFIAEKVSALKVTDGDELEKLADMVFMSFSEFVEESGLAKGIFLYIPYIVFVAPVLWLLGVVSGFAIIL